MTKHHPLHNRRGDRTLAYRDDARQQRELQAATRRERAALHLTEVEARYTVMVRYVQMLCRVGMELDSAIEEHFRNTEEGIRAWEESKELGKQAEAALHTMDPRLRAAADEISILTGMSIDEIHQAYDSGIDSQEAAAAELAHWPWWDARVEWVRSAGSIATGQMHFQPRVGAPSIQF